MMNIKNLNPYKKEFKELLEIMPVSKLEFSLQSASDPFINILYHQLLGADQQVLDPYYKPIIHKAGILGIYCLMDPCYGDIIRSILAGVPKEYINAKVPRLWRINTVYMEQQKC